MKKKLVSAAFAVMICAVPAKSYANCTSLLGPIGLFISEPCPVWDSGLQGAFKKEDVQAAKSLFQSMQQLRATLQQLQNSISIFESLFQRSFNLQNAFTQYNEWNMIPYHTNFTAPNLFNNFQSMVSTVQVNGQMMIQNAETSLTNSFNPWLYAMQSAVNAQVYAVAQQSYDAKNNRSDFKDISSAVTKSTTEQEDWNANLAIHLKIIQQLQIRNTLLARLAAVRASHYSLPLQTRISKDGAPMYQQKTGDNETITYQ